MLPRGRPPALQTHTAHDHSRRQSAPKPSCFSLRAQPDGRRQRCRRPGGARARGRWDLLLRTAELQGVAPLLHTNLARLFPGQIPSPHQERLRQACRGIARMNLSLAAELRRLLERFEERRIPGIPFKGAVLAASAYGSLALRQFGDLDILVHPRDGEAARRLLAELGYVLNYHVAGQEYHFADEGRRNTVDLHQRMASSCFPRRPTSTSFGAGPSRWVWGAGWSEAWLRRTRHSASVSTWRRTTARGKSVSPNSRSRRLMAAEPGPAVESGDGPRPISRPGSASSCWHSGSLASCWGRGCRMRRWLDSKAMPKFLALERWSRNGC